MMTLQIRPQNVQILEQTGESLSEVPMLMISASTWL